MIIKFESLISVNNLFPLKFDSDPLYQTIVSIRFDRMCHNSEFKNRVLFQSLADSVSPIVYVHSILCFATDPNPWSQASRPDICLNLTGIYSSRSAKTDHSSSNEMNAKKSSLLANGFPFLCPLIT
ncbi:hypothetical protein BLOT_001317, partial [Blomia tropicalis]